MTDVLEYHECTVSIGDTINTNLRFADDIHRFVGEEERKIS